jgi:prevent-host-death family protein
MGQRRVGIRELRDKLSGYVGDVKTGATIVVTERGQPVARIVPETHTLDERLAALKSAGAILWSGHRLGPAKPAIRARRKRTVAEIVCGSPDPSVRAPSTRSLS